MRTTTAETGTATGLNVRRVSGALGAVVSGVDLSTDLPAETIAEIRRAFVEHVGQPQRPTLRVA